MQATKKSAEDYEYGDTLALARLCVGGRQVVESHPHTCTKGDAAEKSISINSDLICRVASFMNVQWKGLLNLCIAIGPEEAAKLREEYLLDNDAYLEHNLWDVGASALVYAGSDLLQEEHEEGLETVDRCRRNIMTWMEVNKEWRSRCTEENMTRYMVPVSERGNIRGSPASQRSPANPLYQANAMFNNIVVAIEIGLQDVVRHLIEDMNVDINAAANNYRGFSDIQYPHVIDFALASGKVGMAEYLMTHNSFDLGDLRQREFAVYRVMGNQRVGRECFEAFLRNSGVNLDAGGWTIMPPLHLALYSLNRSIAGVDVKLAALFYQRSKTLLDVGADPRLSWIRAGGTFMPIEYARNGELKERRRQSQSWRYWKKLVEIMEGEIESD